MQRRVINISTSCGHCDRHHRLSDSPRPRRQPAPHVVRAGTVPISCARPSRSSRARPITTALDGYVILTRRLARGRTAYCLARQVGIAFAPADEVVDSIELTDSRPVDLGKLAERALAIAAPSRH